MANSARGSAGLRRRRAGLRRAVAFGQVGVDPGRGRAGKRQAAALAVAAGDPQDAPTALGAEVADVGADDFGDPGPGEQQHRDQRRGAGALRAGRRVGRVDEA